MSGLRTNSSEIFIIGSLPPRRYSRLFAVLSLWSGCRYRPAREKWSRRAYRRRFPTRSGAALRGQAVHLYEVIPKRPAFVEPFLHGPRILTLLGFREPPLRVHHVSAEPRAFADLFIGQRGSTVE